MERELRNSLHLDVQELAGWISLLPVSASFPKQPAVVDCGFYERLFDPKALFGVKDPVTGELNQTLTYHHHSLNAKTSGDNALDPKTPLILAALGISETELLQLLAMLRQDIPFDVNGNTALDRARPKSQQVREARLQLQATAEAKVNAEQRVEHSQGLVDTGLIEWEVAQQATRHAATSLKVAESAGQLMSAIFYLIPQLGNPSP